MDDKTPNRGDGLEYRSDGETYRVEFSQEHGQPSTAVVKAIAAIEGWKQDELDPLYHVIDPDALDSLFKPTVRGDHHGDAEISFTYHGFAVTVRSYGIIEVEPNPAGAGTPDGER